MNLRNIKSYRSNYVLEHPEYMIQIHYTSWRPLMDLSQYRKIARGIIESIDNIDQTHVASRHADKNMESEWQLSRLPWTGVPQPKNV